MEYLLLEFGGFLSITMIVKNDVLWCYCVINSSVLSTATEVLVKEVDLFQKCKVTCSKRNTHRQTPLSAIFLSLFTLIEPFRGILRVDVHLTAEPGYVELERYANARKRPICEK